MPRLPAAHPAWTLTVRCLHQSDPQGVGPWLGPQSPAQDARRRGWGPAATPSGHQPGGCFLHGLWLMASGPLHRDRPRCPHG